MFKVQNCRTLAKTIGVSVPARLMIRASAYDRVAESLHQFVSALGPGRWRRRLDRARVVHLVSRPGDCLWAGGDHGRHRPPLEVRWFPARREDAAARCRRVSLPLFTYSTP